MIFFLESVNGDGRNEIRKSVGAEGLPAGYTDEHRYTPIIAGGLFVGG
jgi:hypothetical protein